MGMVNPTAHFWVDLIVLPSAIIWLKFGNIFDWNSKILQQFYSLEQHLPPSQSDLLLFCLKRSYSHRHRLLCLLVIQIISHSLRPVFRGASMSIACSVYPWCYCIQNKQPTAISYCCHTQMEISWTTSQISLPWSQVICSQFALALLT